MQCKKHLSSSLLLLNSDLKMKENDTTHLLSFTAVVSHSGKGCKYQIHHCVWGQLATSRQNRRQICVTGWHMHAGSVENCTVSDPIGGGMLLN
jgi:hypothetical protein